MFRALPRGEVFAEGDTHMARLLRALSVAVALLVASAGTYVVVHQPMPQAEAGCIPEDQCSNGNASEVCP